ncbi:hypothetical protein DM860_015033 [Cuscuta australis]|uniref:Pentacotripeptide-repeat region of PRORP domain-containing protein n=1 Tax=Cuscuta australis TaxID=267555 RepID=A0A328DDZ2_9ASTE|nr:hypothetical protein DM860_015033 [Cuscuta australis]
MVVGRISRRRQRLTFRIISRYQHRGFATKYSGRVVAEADNGRSFAIEVDSPSLQTDTRGYVLPRRDLICKVSQILQAPPSPSSDQFLDLSDYLDSLHLNLTPSEASEVLKSLKSPTLALRFFRFCPAKIPNFRHDAFTYNRIILILSKSSLPTRLDQIHEIVGQMERSRTRGNISTVNLLVGVIGSSNGEDGSELKRWLELIKKWDLRLTCYTYKCLLQAYLRLSDSSKALNVYQEMRMRGYTLDIFSYNKLIDALAKDEKVLSLTSSSSVNNRASLYSIMKLDSMPIMSYVWCQVEQAYKVFDDMHKRHCEPDVYTYTILIRMKGKAGKPNESLVLFQEMLAKGCSPNLFAYNTMIQTLSKSRMVEKTLFLFSKMVENNCRPNELTYSFILHVLAAESQLHRLDEVVEISQRFMNKSTYAYLVRTLNKLGHAGEAHRLFCSMWNFHDSGDRDAYLSMLESLCSAGKVSEAIDLLSKMHEKGTGTDTFMYNIVFTALGKSKQIPHIHDLYEKMKQSGVSPDLFTYNILISSFGRAGRVAEAVKVFEELESSSSWEPNTVSYNSLINCLGKNGDVDEAHMRFIEMQEKGLNPDVVTYSTLIECFGKTEKVEMACQLFDEMLGVGCSPNIVTYNILLDCLERCGRTAEALDFYARLKENSLVPDSITYAILDRLRSGGQRTIRVRRQNPITGWVVSPLR